MKFKGSIYCETKVNCKLCGKQFEGNSDKVERKFIIHALTRHPFYLIKTRLTSKFDE